MSSEPHPLTPLDAADPDLITDPKGDTAAFHLASGGTDCWIRFDECLLTEVEP